MISKKLARQSRHKWALRLVSNGLKHGEAMTQVFRQRVSRLCFFWGKSRLARQRGWRSTSSQEPSALIPQVVCWMTSPDLGLISKKKTWGRFANSHKKNMVDFTRNYSGEVSLKNHQHLLSKFVSTSLNPGLWMRNPWHDGQFDEHYFWLRRIKCQLAYSFLRQTMGHQPIRFSLSFQAEAKYEG